MTHEDGLGWKLTRARTQLLLNQPFFGTLCLRLKMMAADVPTMATDGQRIVYNPAFAAELKPAELEAVLAHEVMHCALGHHCRRGERDAVLWNQAADFAINPILVRNGFTLPQGALLDPKFENMCAEEIYAHLRQDGNAGEPLSSQTGEPGSGAGQRTTSSQIANQPFKSGSASGNKGLRAGESQGPGEVRPGGFGEVIDASDEEGSSASQAESERQAREWSIAASQALRSAESCGQKPNDVRRPLQESRASKQDWRAILRDFVAATAPADYRWTPPNRRYIAAGIYLPSVERQGVGAIVIGVDTSGSISDRELEQFAGEISAIASDAQPESIHVVYCDAAVQCWQEFAACEPIDLHAVGGGGTDFRPVFDWVRESEVVPACLIYLTDLCCHSYPEVPDYPVLWVTNSRRTAPWGETLRVSADGI